MKLLATHAAVLCAIGVVGLHSLRADILHLKDGSSIEGDVKHADDGWVVHLEHGATTRIASDQVQSIELTASASNGPKVAAERLASLRRSIENLSDLSQIISRYQRMIEQIKDQAALAEAKKDLAVWQDRADNNLVKVGNKWVPAEERAKLVEEALGLAEQARQLMKQGRAKEAEPLLNQAIGDDPENASALYLLGLLRFQQDQAPAARKAFEAVNRLVPNHGPTLNNLAVVQWRQRQFGAALISFDGAMLASPVNKQILDNVASALESLPIESQNTIVTQRVTRHFQEQDRQLSEQMAQLGWHRVGAVWVTDREMDAIRQQQKDAQDKLDALAAEFEKSKSQLADVDQRIDDTEEQMHRIEAGSYVRDPGSGLLLRVPYPAVYYDLQRDDARLHQARDAQVVKLDAMKETAQTLQKQLPGAKAVEVQRMIGPEGTPLRIPDPPTSRPAITSPGAQQQ